MVSKLMALVQLDVSLFIQKKLRVFACRIHRRRAVYLLLKSSYELKPGRSRHLPRLRHNPHTPSFGNSRRKKKQKKKKEKKKTREEKKEKKRRGVEKQDKTKVKKEGRKTAKKNSPLKFAAKRFRGGHR